MLKVRITGVGVLDGEYPLDLDMSNDQYRTVKRMSGVRGGELSDAFDADDTTFYVALVAVALEQNGVAYNEKVLWAVKPSAFDVIGDEEEAEKDPPAPASSPGSSNVSSRSGSSSSNGSDTDQATSTPPTSGSQPSETTASSDPAISAG